VQDYLLQTLVYTAERLKSRYFAQAAVVYRETIGASDSILPRFSATLLEAKAERILTATNWGCVKFSTARKKFAN